MRIHLHTETGGHPARSFRPHVPVLAWYRPVLPYAAIGAVLVAGLATGVVRQSLTGPVLFAIAVACAGAAIWGYAHTFWLRDQADRSIRGDGAAGTPPAVVTARARELVGARHRHMLSSGLRRVVDDIDRPALVSARVPINRLGIALEHHKLERICALLDDPSRSVTPRSVALLENLMSDPGSPLYNGGGRSGGRLDERLRQIVFEMEARS